MLFQWKQYIIMTIKKQYRHRFRKEVSLMIYHSTRSKLYRADSAQAVLDGLAADGGLYVPDQLPKIQAEYCLSLAPQQMASYIIGAFLPDIPDMDSLVHRAYSGKFAAPDLTPTVQAGPFTVLELFHGPTCAFKDVALCMLPQLLSAAKAQKGLKEEVLILTATSGDTGKAAMEGFKDVPGTRICVFYPHGGVSTVQQAQMATQEGNNVSVFAVRGNFDDAQRGVKNIFGAIGNSLTPGGCRLSTANSINIGRLAPQVTYYFKAYKDLVDRGTVKMGDPVHFSVPTGNFGDILAGYLAKLLGLPVGKLLCASNANNVLTDFIETGVYDRRRPLFKTVSPSMDILVSSNLERLLYLMSQDTQLVSGLMEQLNQDGHYAVPEELLKQIRQEFYGAYCSDEQTRDVIQKVWQEHRYLCDTHTAAGWYAAAKYRAETGDKTPIVVLSTASPYKFPAAVLSALEKTELQDEWQMLDRLQELTGSPIPKNLQAVRTKEIRHKTVIDPQQMLGVVSDL